MSRSCSQIPSPRRSSVRPRRDSCATTRLERLATQDWKQERFLDAGLTPPDNLTFVAMDLVTDDLPTAVAAAGFDAALPCVVSMLGVVIYLPRELVLDLLRFAASLASGSSIVFDYGVSRERLAPELVAARDAATTRAAGSAEAYITFLDPEWLARQARIMGFTRVDDLDYEAVNRRYFRDRTDGLELDASGRRLVALTVEQDRR